MGKGRGRDWKPGQPVDDNGQTLVKLPKTLKSLVRARTSHKDPLQDFIRRIPGGKASVMALLERSSHDDEARKLIRAWKAVRSVDGTNIRNLNMQTVLDEAEIDARDFVGIVTRCAWDFNMEVAKGIFAMRYPQMMEASMLRAVEPDATREREIHFQATGHLPMSKGVQIGIAQTNITEREPGEAPSVSRTARKIVRDLPPAS